MVIRPSMPTQSSPPRDPIAIITITNRDPLEGYVEWRDFGVFGVETRKEGDIDFFTGKGITILPGTVIVKNHEHPLRA